MTDEQLAAAVAEGVMGCFRTPDGLWHGESGWTFRIDTPALPTNWSPATDIAAAWEVLEKLNALGWQVRLKISPGYAYIRLVDVLDGSDRGDTTCSDETAPLAICYAALATVRS